MTMALYIVTLHTFSFVMTVLHRLVVGISLLFILGSTFFIYAAEGPSGILLSGVMYNPLGADTGGEYVELINTSNTVISIGGYELDASELPYFTIPAGTEMLAGATVRIHLRSDGINSATDIYTGGSFGSSNMSNTKGMVALFVGSDHTPEFLVDYLAYGAAGQTHMSSAVAQGLWGESEYVELGSEGEQLYRVCYEALLECYGIGASGGDDNPTDVSMGVELYVGEAIVDTGDTRAFVDEDILLTTSSGTLLSYHVDEEQWQETITGSAYLDLDVDTHHVEYYTSSGTQLTEMVSKDITVVGYPVLEMREISFLALDGEEDFIEFMVMDDGSMGEGLLLSDVIVEVDNARIVLPAEYAQVGDLVVIVFGDTSDFVPNIEGVHVVSIPEIDNLVSTTEQVVIYARNNTPLSGVCWSNTTPTSSEQIEQSEFMDYGIWPHSTCLSSTGLSKGDTYHMVEDGWQVYAMATPGEGPPANPVSGSSVSSGGNSSDDSSCTEPVGLVLNEIHPNPKGADTGKEWVELYNSSNVSITLCEVGIDDAPGGTPTLMLPTVVISAGDFLVLEGETLPQVLNNTEDSVRLLFGDRVIDEISYTNAPEGESYSRF